MRLVVAAIERATDDGHRAAERTRVVQAMFAGRAHGGPLGTYRIRHDGDTSLKAYGVYQVLAGGLHYWKTVRG